MDALACKPKLSKDIHFDLKFFSLADLDSSKCENKEVFFKAKSPNPHESENKGYLRNCWNAFRPYIKCNCYKNNKNCKAGIMWVDHLLWFMVHNLNKFFALSSQPAKIFACINWISSLPAKVKDVVLIYYYFHSFMLDKAKSIGDSSLPTPNLPSESKAHELIVRMFSPSTAQTPVQPTKKGRYASNSPYTPLHSASSSTTSTGRLVHGSRVKELDLTEVQ